MAIALKPIEVLHFEAWLAIRVAKPVRLLIAVDHQDLQARGYSKGFEHSHHEHFFAEWQRPTYAGSDAWRARTLFRCSNQRTLGNVVKTAVWRGFDVNVGGMGRAHSNLTRRDASVCQAYFTRKQIRPYGVECYCRVTSLAEISWIGNW